MSESLLCASIRLIAVVLCWVSFATPGRAAESDVVINEIMYHPPLDLDDLQYIELFNRGNAAVDLSKWSFTKGIQFTFPEKTQLAAGGYLVVCRKAAVFSANYGNVPAVGDFAGKLSHGGEKIEISNAAGNVIDTVKYSDKDPWPSAPDGYSASLERICPFLPGEHAANWAGSKLPPTEKPAGTPGRKNDNFSTNLPPANRHAGAFPHQSSQCGRHNSFSSGAERAPPYILLLDFREHELRSSSFRLRHQRLTATA